MWLSTEGGRRGEVIKPATRRRGVARAGAGAGGGSGGAVFQCRSRCREGGGVDRIISRPSVGGELAVRPAGWGAAGGRGVYTCAFFMINMREGGGWGELCVVYGVCWTLIDIFVLCTVHGLDMEIVSLIYFPGGRGGWGATIIFVEYGKLAGKSLFIPDFAVGARRCNDHAFTLFFVCFSVKNDRVATLQRCSSSND